MYRGGSGKHHGIILSTHILPEVQATCTRVQLIHQGQSVFNQSMQSLKQNRQVILRLQQTPSIDELKSLPGVQTIDSISNGHYLLSGQELSASLTEISQQCVNNDWGLLEISQKENSLEQVFLNLTSGESNEATA